MLLLCSPAALEMGTSSRMLGPDMFLVFLPQKALSCVYGGHCVQQITASTVGFGLSLTHTAPCFVPAAETMNAEFRTDGQH